MEYYNEEIKNASDGNATLRKSEYKMNLLENVHINMKPPSTNGRTYLVRGNYSYFHYNCDGLNDTGWGCGYRTLQTMCSQIKSLKNLDTIKIPTIPEIQTALIEIGDKPVNFKNSRDWIGTVEVCYVVDRLLDTPCKILHVGQNQTLADYFEAIKEYFVQYGGIVMMGGEMDTASKGICGLHIDGNDVYLLILDPHFSGIAYSVQQLQQLGFVKWQHVLEFNDFNYFYNLCMPIIK